MLRYPRQHVDTLGFIIPVREVAASLGNADAGCTLAAELDQLSDLDGRGAITVLAQAIVVEIVAFQFENRVWQHTGLQHGRFTGPQIMRKRGQFRIVFQGQCERLTQRQRGNAVFCCGCDWFGGDDQTVR